MEKKIIFWVVSLSLVAVALTILLPGGRQADPYPKLPWEIQLTPERSVKVFELTLGSSTLADARRIFQLEGETDLFVGEDGKLALEAYFEQVFLSGLRGDFVLVMTAGEDLLQQLYARGSRISRTSDATHKVQLGSEDQALVNDLPVRLINYIPYANLDEELVKSRFGEPARKITEAETGITQWIYPDRGVSVGLNPHGKEMIQYMPLNEVAGFVERIEANNQSYQSASKGQG